MRKKSLLALMLAATLLLSGCALIVKDQAVDDATPILTLGDQVVTKKQVLAEAQSELDEMAQYYAMFGQTYDTTSSQAIASARQSAVLSLKTDMVLTAKVEELDLASQLTEEDLASINTSAEESLNNAVDYITTYRLSDSGLEGDALREEALRILDEEYGITLASYQEAQRRTMLDDKLRAYIVKDVTISDEEIQAEYDSRVTTDQEQYLSSAGACASAINSGTTVYYMPAGIRRVKQILIKFKPEDQTAISDAQTAVNTAQAKVDAANEILNDDGAGEEARAQAQTDLEAATTELEAANTALTNARETAFANIDADADAVIARLEAGEDWDTVMAEKNEDPGMQSGDSAEHGYAVSADMTSFDSAFVEAAMALNAVGDVSPKTRGNAYGYYIIRYVGDEAEGPVPLETVRETIHSSLLSTRQNEVYNATVSQWVEEAPFREDLNALKD